MKWLEIANFVLSVLLVAQTGILIWTVHRVVTLGLVLGEILTSNVTVGSSGECTTSDGV